MPSDPPILPRKWFIIAASVPVLLATFLILILFLVGIVKQEHGGSSPSTSQESPGSDVETVTLKQRTANGTPIPWGSLSPGNLVELEVVSSRSERYTSADVHVLHDGVDYFDQSAGEFTVKLAPLPPGNYQWSAVLRTGEGLATGTINPPRATLGATDFIIQPLVLEVRHLRQKRLNGTSINVDNLTTESGATLSADVNLPGSILEIEVKATDTPFDEKNTLFSTVSKEGLASRNFSGSEGKYRWRARAEGPDGKKTEWQEMHFTAEADFIVVSPTPTPAEEKAEGVTTSLSSGGSGPNEPLPSIVRPQADLWSFFYSKGLLYAAAAAIGLSLVGWLGIRHVRRQTRSKP